MLEAETKTIEGIDFNFVPMDPFAVARLEKQLAPLLLPVIGGLKNLDDSSSFDLDALSRGMQSAIANLPDEQFESMLKTLLKHVTVITDRGASSCDTGLGARTFQGNTLLMYRVCTEVMRYNKFIPFALAELGGPMTAIATSIARSTAQQQTGLKLGQ